MANNTYADDYRGIDFRKYPEKYRIGRGEQGVLIAEPYKSELLPYWKFATPEAAKKSAQQLYKCFLNYGRFNDFVGMDMARKYLQMGFTRARRYANHRGGKKYAASGKVRPQEVDWNTSEKAQSAAIFFEYYQKAKADVRYLELKDQHQTRMSG